MDQDVLIWDDEEPGSWDPSMTQVERNRILKNLFIDKGRQANNPGYIIPSTS